TPASGEPRRGLRSAAAVELLTSFCLCFLKKPVRQDGVYGAVTYAQYPMAHNGIVELLCIYGFIFGGLAVLLLLLLFVYSVFLLVFRRRKTACTELGFLCSAFIIWFVNYVFSGGGLFHPVGAALFWLVVFRFLYILRRKRDVEHISKEVVYG
ncbi:hypothetical protein ABZR31_32170, partial [Pseudomonas aeruginosa]